MILQRCLIEHLNVHERYTSNYRISTEIDIKNVLI